MTKDFIEDSYEEYDEYEDDYCLGCPDRWDVWRNAKQSVGL